MPDTGSAVLMPFYLAIDVSWSMTAADDTEHPGETRLDLANQIAPGIVDAVREDPRTGDKVRLGVVSFSGETQVDLPLVDARNLSADDIPTLKPRTTGTSYASLFLTLRQRIESDVAQLKATGFRLSRPTVFLITDGEPTDQTQDWQDAFKVLTDRGFRARPNVVPFGVGGATHQTLDQVADYKASLDGGPSGQHTQAFVQGEINATAALRQLIPVLIGSIVSSAGDPTNNNSLVLATPVADEEEIDDEI